MESLYLLIPVALIFCALVIKLLLWAIDSGQYDDLEKESWRIISDEDDADLRPLARNESCNKSREDSQHDNRKESRDGCRYTSNRGGNSA